MSKYQYQITLRPLSKFFFGGERHFDEGESIFYFQKSREFPQQTSILGLLRYQLLLQNGLLEYSNRGPRVAPPRLGEAAELIGEESFNGQDGQSFGQIKKLSPVFIADENGGRWITYPKARVKGNAKELQVIFLKDGKLLLGEEVKAQIPLLQPFHHKEGIEYGFKNLEKDAFRPRGEVFREEVQEEEQIGVYKPYRKGGVVKQAEDEGFYKYQYCHLNEGYAFGCFVETDTPLGLSNAIVRWAKERVPFEMEIQEKANPFLNAPFGPGSRLLLLSDSLLEAKWAGLCKAAVTNILPFRNLSYKIQDAEVNYMAEPSRGDRRNLLEKGSILVAGDEPAQAKGLEGMIAKPKAFLAIGYNHYKVL